MALQHLRSSTTDKRPTPGAMSDGQLAVNTAAASPGLFFKDASGSLVKVGPVHVGTTAPNASPAAGGETGNTLGEQWLDTTGGTYVFKVWDGSAWRSETGTFVDVNGDTMTGALGIIAGSAASPGLFVSGDTNTGIYSPGADQLAISTNGSGRLFVDSNGRIGVGTSSPSSLLHLASNETLQIVESTGASTNTTIQLKYPSRTWSLATRGADLSGAFVVRDVTASADRLAIDSSGRVGIGTSSPDSILDVRSSTAAGRTNVSFLNPASPNTANRIRIRLAPSSGFVGIDSHPYIESYCEDAVNQFAGLAFGTYGSGGALSERLRIDSSGRVGIGSSTPDELCHVEGGNLRVSGTRTAGSFLSIIPNNTGSNGARLVVSYYGSGSYGPLEFWTGGSQRAQIDASGRLLVGTSSSFDANCTLQSVGAAAAQFFRFGADGCSVYIGCARGTQGSPSALGSGDVIGALSFRGYDGGAYRDGASIRADVDAAVGSGDFPSRLVFSTTRDGQASPTEACRIDSNQRLVVGGTSAQSSRLLVKGENTASSEFACTLIDSSSLTLFAVRNDGYILTGTGATSPYNLTTASAANVWVGANGELRRSTSSIKYKTDVTDANYGLQDLLSLRPVTYKGKNDGNTVFGGLIAEEVDAAGLTQFVQYAEDGTPDAIAYSNMVSLCIKAIQEQQVVISELQAKVAALESA